MSNKMIKTLILLASVTVSLLWIPAQAENFDHEHQKLTSLLNSYVKRDKYASCVKYFDLIKDPRLLNEYLSAVSAVSKKDFESWTEQQKLAFLINSYNAYTIKLVTMALSIEPNAKSIKSFGLILSDTLWNKALSFFGKKVSSLVENPWKLKMVNLFGEKIDLDTIEHKLTREKFDEPRIHFAFNCASIGCPALQVEAFTAKRLESQLEFAAIQFLSDNTKNRFDANLNKLLLSEIFDWYGEDFEDSKKYGSITKAVSKWLPMSPGKKAEVSKNKIPIDYLEYDWNLNVCR